MLGAETVQSVESATPLWEIIAWTVSRVAFVYLLMLVVGKRGSPWLRRVAKTGFARTLLLLCVLAVAIGIAWLRCLRSLFRLLCFGCFSSGMW